MQRFCCPCLSPCSPKELKEKTSQKQSNVIESERDINNRTPSEKNQFSTISGVRMNLELTNCVLRYTS